MQGKTILIVEDDDSIRNTLKIALEFEGYHVEAGSNGKEGLDLLYQMERPCLIILDMMMPVMDGLGFLAALKKEPQFAGLSIIIVTAFSEKTQATSQVSQVIKKPVDLNYLLDIVRHYCPDTR
jgi:CheY-like chemotaxis protein